MKPTSAPAAAASEAAAKRALSPRVCALGLMPTMASFFRGQVLGEGRGDQRREFRIGRGIEGDIDLAQAEAAVGGDIGHGEQAAPRAGVDVAGVALGVLEDQVIVAADQQAAIGQQRQDAAIGNDAGMAEDDVQVPRRQVGLEIGGGPFDRRGDVQLLAADALG